MVSQVWIDAMSGYAQMWGIAPQYMVVIFAFVIAMVMAIIITVKFAKDKEDYNKMGLALFMVIMLLECLVGAMEWIIFILLLLIFGLYEYKMGVNK